MAQNEPIQIIPVPAGKYFAVYAEEKGHPTIEPLDFIALCELREETSKNELIERGIYAVTFTSGRFDVERPGETVNFMGVYRGPETSLLRSIMPEQAAFRKLLDGAATLAGKTPWTPLTIPPHEFVPCCHHSEHAGWCGDCDRVFADPVHTS